MTNVAGEKKIQKIYSLIFFSSVTFSQQNFTVTKGAFFSDPLSFSPHDITKFRVRHETRLRLGYASPVYWDRLGFLSEQ